MVALAAPGYAQRSRPNRPPPIKLPGGPVRQVILDNCTGCHGIDDYAYSALDQAGWNALLENKHKDLKTIISDANRSILLGYLATQFGPNTKAFKPLQIRQDAPITEAAIKTILDASCTVCHSLDVILASRYTEERWRTVVTEMRSKGARLDDTNYEALVVYLARVQGVN